MNWNYGGFNHDWMRKTGKRIKAWAAGCCGTFSSLRLFVPLKEDGKLPELPMRKPGL